MLKIWGRANSINVQKVLWCCHELDLDFQRIDAGGSFGLNDEPDYLARNPNGLVPVIEDGDTVLWESNVIVRYLSARYGAGSLYPDDLVARFDVERWMDWQATTLWPALRPVFWMLTRTPEAERDAQALRAGQEATERALAVLDAQLAERAFVGGESFTMGDIPVGISAYRWFALPLQRRELAHLRRWYERLAERPGFQRRVMLPLT